MPQDPPSLLPALQALARCDLYLLVVVTRLKVPSHLPPLV